MNFYTLSVFSTHDDLKNQQNESIAKEGNRGMKILILTKNETERRERRRGREKKKRVAQEKLCSSFFFMTCCDSGGRLIRFDFVTDGNYFPPVFLGVFISFSPSSSFFIEESSTFSYPLLVQSIARIGIILTLYIKDSYFC